MSIQIFPVFGHCDLLCYPPTGLCFYIFMIFWWLKDLVLEVLEYLILSGKFFDTGNACEKRLFFRLFLELFFNSVL